MKKPGIPRKKSLNSILIKPAGPDCNMACAYCFYREKEALFPASSVHRMSEAVLEETTRQLFAQTVPAFSIGWQGGEPTLMGLEFFQKAVDLQVRFGRGKSVGNGLQTNGLLLDRNWAAFLNRYQFLVGLSLDGPEHVHDHLTPLSRVADAVGVQPLGNRRADRHSGVEGRVRERASEQYGQRRAGYRSRLCLCTGLS